MAGNGLLFRVSLAEGLCKIAERVAEGLLLGTPPGRVPNGAWVIPAGENHRGALRGRQCENRTARAVLERGQLPAGETCTGSLSGVD